MIRQMLEKLFPDRRPVEGEAQVQRRRDIQNVVAHATSSTREAERVIRMLEAEARASRGGEIQ